ncbi:hypothetical protein [uncultured Psychroserpens sp.]|uniref:hypothetical protein n=1 Tax=uncultured Psychroserpens sp. TaxID=255436 RepID=UPI002628548E|nr:hypothetical protein [uncultured Psychroserpens sp.]
MKNLFVFFLVTTFLFGCKNEPKAEDESNSETDKVEDANGKTAKQNDGLTLMSGEFIHYADAAVLKSNNTIYGIVTNEKMNELVDLSKPYKDNPTDDVKVQIRGKLIPKPENEEGWPYQIVIKEIVSVKKNESTNSDVIKLGSSKSE